MEVKACIRRKLMMAAGVSLDMRRFYSPPNNLNHFWWGLMSSQPWWQSATIYQVYPRSFQDTNADGIGDLNGIQHRLPYLRELGVDAIWISPIFTSPMKDFGYDVSDYRAIDPLFGTMDDFDALLAAAHECGLRLLLDLVPNHTSDQHPWFQESRSSRTNPKRDWYIWHDPKPDGSPPNNWLSEFGGSAWEYDAASGQYYYHAFLASQPDLNWHNDEVRGAIYDVMRFWLRKGVDGFRVDVIWHLIKDPQFRDNPVNPDYKPGQPPHQKLIPLHTTDLPGVHEVVREMRAVVDEFPDRLLIGEIYLPIEKLVTYYGRDLRGAHLPFNFTLLETEWDARRIASLIEQYYAELPKGGWPNWVLGNHDRPRIASRVGAAQARVAAMLLLTLRGTPTIYYGDEIGLPQVPIPRDRIRDPFEKNVPGIGVGRDGARTPMQWDDHTYSGFSKSDPWLPLAPHWRENNVEHLRHEADSIYTLYRRVMHSRRHYKALNLGDYRAVHAQGDLLAFAREWENQRILVALNFGDYPATAKFGEDVRGRILISTYCDSADEPVASRINLRGNEGVIIELALGARIPSAVLS
jgi:alpha-glucosidase